MVLATDCEQVKFYNSSRTQWNRIGNGVADSQSICLLVQELKEVNEKHQLRGYIGKLALNNIVVFLH